MGYSSLFFGATWLSKYSVYGPGLSFYRLVKEEQTAVQNPCKGTLVRDCVVSACFFSSKSMGIWFYVGMAPMTALVSDPCPSGSPETRSVAHVSRSLVGSLFTKAYTLTALWPNSGQHTLFFESFLREHPAGHLFVQARSFLSYAPDVPYQHGPGRKGVCLLGCCQGT